MRISHTFHPVNETSRTIRKELETDHSLSAWPGNKRFTLWNEREKVSEGSREKGSERDARGGCSSAAALLLICMLYISEHLYLCFVLKLEQSYCSSNNDERWWERCLDKCTILARLSDRFYLSYKSSVWIPSGWFQREIGWICKRKTYKRICMDRGCEFKSVFCKFRNYLL